MPVCCVCVCVCVCAVWILWHQPWWSRCWTRSPVRRQRRYVNCCLCLTSTFKPSCGCTYCLQYAGVKGKDWVDRLSGKATITSGLCLRRSALLWSFRCCLWAQNQRHHPIDCLEERGRSTEWGSAWQTSLKGQEQAIVSRMSSGTDLKATLERLLNDGVELMWAFWSA